MKKLFIFSVAIMCYVFSMAQTDNEFWFVAPKVNKNHGFPGGKPIRLIFTNVNDVDAYVTVYMPANNNWNDTTIIVGKKMTTAWDMTSRINKVVNEYDTTNALGTWNLNNKGLYIVSRSNPFILDSRIDITAYYESGTTNNPEIFTLKGRNAIGTEFFTSFQTDMYNVNGGSGATANWEEPAYSAIDIVFTEDNTTLDVVIPAGKFIFNGPGKSPLGKALSADTVTFGPFDAGYTLTLIPAMTTAPEKTGWHATDKYFGRAAKDHLAGVQIKTRNGRKVAVTLKDDSMKSLIGGCYDLSGDQTIPVNLTGTDYIAMRGELMTGYPDTANWYNGFSKTHQWYNTIPDVKKPVALERLYIMATDNNTHLQINGVDVPVTLNAGETYIYPIPSTEPYVQIHSLDSAIYVLQLTGFGCEMGEAILPPISTCTGSTNIGFSRSTNEGFYQRIIVRSTAKDGFLINGVTSTYLDSSKFTDIGNTGWSAARLGFKNTGADTVGNSLFKVQKQSMISNTKDVFHLGIINGGASSGVRYGYFSNYNLVKPSALISESGSEEIMLYYGESVQIYAKGGIFYNWSPSNFLNDSISEHPIATPPHTITYKASVSGYCGTLDSTYIKIIVAKGYPKINWNNPVDITYGTLLSTDELNATSIVPGTFTYLPPNGYQLNVGNNQVLSVNFMPTDTANYKAVSKSVEINVLKINPLITWNKPADIIYGTPLGITELNATSDVAGTFKYSPDIDSVLNPGNNQNLYVEFIPDDANIYNTVSKTVQINILKLNPIITWNQPGDITYGTPLTTSELNAIANVAGTFTYSPDINSVINAGINQDLTVIFTPADAVNYNSASKTVQINVAKANPVITWSNPADITYGTVLNDVQFNASANVSGNFVYTPTSGSKLNAGDAQDIDVQFTPDDVANYNTVSKAVKINVAKANPVITWNNPADITYGALLSDVQFNAAADVAGNFVYTPTSGTKLNAGNAQDIAVEFTPTDAANYNTVSKAVKINVVKANPVITWSNPADIIFGTALNTDQYNATANVSGSFVYTPTSGTILNAGNAQGIAVQFTPDDAANYNISSKLVQINVAKANPVITWSNPADITLGTALSVTQLNATANVDGIFVYTPASGTKLSVGNAQILSVVFTATDAANYNTASKSVKINVTIGTGINSVADNSNVEVLPNPFTEKITLKNISLYNQLTICDITGKIILKNKISGNEMEIDLSTIKNGNYIIILKNESNWVSKIVIKKE